MKKTLLAALVIVTLTFSLSAMAADTPVLQLTVQKAVDLALQNNPDLKKALYAQKTAQAQLEKAKSGNYPTVSLNLSYNPKLDGGYYFFGNANNGTTVANVNYGINANYNLYDGGQTKFTIKQAENALEQAGVALEKQKQALKYTTISAYYDAINTANQVKVQESGLKNATDHLNIAQVKFEEGAVPKGDVLNNQATVSGNKKNLIVAKNSYNKALLTLKNTMNVPANTVIQLTEELSVSSKTIDQKQLLDYATVNNPDIKLAKLAVQNLEFKRKADEAGNYPTVSIGASGSQGFNQNVGQTYSNSFAIGLNASVNYNLFDGYSTRNQLVADDMQSEQQKQALDSTVLSTNLSVSSAIDDISAEIEYINAARATLDYAREDLEIKTIRYESGVGTNIDVVDAQKTLVSSQATYWEAIYQYNLSLANLDKVIGTPVK